MLNISGSIILGVTTGVLTSVFIWIVVKTFQKIILPWYQSITYRGVKISGSWSGFKTQESFKDPESDPDLNIYLEQMGHFVKGEITVNKNVGSAKEKENKILVFTGLFRDGNLIITYFPKDETRLGCGAIVMKLKGDGRKLEGMWLLISATSGNIVETDSFWRKDES